MKQLPSLQVSSFKLLDNELLCDFSTGTPRPLLPPLFRYPRHPHPLPYRYPCNQAYDVIKMGLDWHGSRHSAVVS